MVLWQRDLFDTSLDLIIFNTTNRLTESAKPKTKKNQPSQEGGAPWLFQDESPDHQAAIKETKFSWSDSDISLLCEGVLWDAVYSLLTTKCGNGLREDAVKWLLSTPLIPFSFRHCCMEMQVNPERMLQGISQQVLQRRSFLRKQEHLTPKEYELLDWMNGERWMEEVTQVDIMASCGTHYNPTEIIAHYERQARQPDCNV